MHLGKKSGEDIFCVSIGPRKSKAVLWGKKERHGGRKEGKDKNSGSKQRRAECSEKSVLFCLICVNQMFGVKKCRQHTKEKNGDVNGSKMYAESTGVGIVKCGNKQAAKEIAFAERTADVRTGFPEAADSISGKQQHGKKQ